MTKTTTRKTTRRRTRRTQSRTIERKFILYLMKIKEVSVSTHGTRPGRPQTPGANEIRKLKNQQRQNMIQLLTLLFASIAYGGSITTNWFQASWQLTPDGRALDFSLAGKSKGWVAIGWFDDEFSFFSVSLLIRLFLCLPSLSLSLCVFLFCLFQLFARRQHFVRFEFANLVTGLCRQSSTERRT